MNIREIFSDYRQGGRNYIKQIPKGWCGFEKTVIDKLSSSFGLDFNIIIEISTSGNDYYCVPFRTLEHLFVSDNLTTGELAEQGRKRWTATINNHAFEMGNSGLSLDIRQYYGQSDAIAAPNYKTIDEIFGVDYSIEDARANAKIRLGQSAFRKHVLENFASRCCISSVTESSLLVASHIVPWAHDKSCRSDPSNGLCLFVEYDSYFDGGYISVGANAEVLVTDRLVELSTPIRARLSALKGKVIEAPTKYKIREDYLEYHRLNIFERF